MTPLGNLGEITCLISAESVVVFWLGMVFFDVAVEVKYVSSFARQFFLLSSHSQHQKFV
ncbi:MAG: hypothetical protein F6K24_26805 [Okeania sp. SIO2D1]|nr:hypothetical protein [Okeania sp. SIO2D1]